MRAAVEYERGQASYGLAAVRVRPRRWLHVRAFVDFDGSSADATVREGPVVEALTRLLRSAAAEATVVAAPR